MSEQVATENSTLELTGQVAVVTGAARGIGRAVSSRLAAMGAAVVLLARDAAALDDVRREIESTGGAADTAACDLLHPQAVASLGERVRSTYGRCDILVNNAGIGNQGRPLHEMAVEDWDRLMATNLRAPYLMIRALAPLMIQAKSGHIVNISSLAGKNPLPNGAAYSASKWGLNGLSYSVAEELRQHNIRVSVVSPGSVNTHFGAAGGTDPGKSASGKDPNNASGKDPNNASGKDPNNAGGKDPNKKIQPEDVASIVAMLVTQPPQSFISEVLVRPTQK